MPHHHPLNPFLRGFFQSALPAQCAPISHYILLVPTTEILLHGKDSESNTSYADFAATEEFLASHVLRAPGAGPPPLAEQAARAGGVGKDGSGNTPTPARELKSKARQYATLNGKTVIIKDSLVYSNKGFKTLNQAHLLADSIFYPPDAADSSQQWLIYYISRPLIGAYQTTLPPPAVLSDEPSKERRRLLAEAAADVVMAGGSAGAAGAPKKKDIKTFGDLLDQFPLIARQMQSGLEKIIREFLAANENKPTSNTLTRTRSSSQSSHRSTPSLSDVASIRSARSGVSSSGSTLHPTALELTPEEQTLQTALETAIIAAIDLFQSVDKQQLSHLGASTDLTGPMVERLLERYIAEQVHDHALFPSVCAVRKADDAELDAKIRRMHDVDIAQVGVPIEDGMRGKRRLAARLARGVEAFKKLGVAGSPQEMLEILLHTQKVITEEAGVPVPAASAEGVQAAEEEAEEEEENAAAAAAAGVVATPSKMLTVNADVLVSMLLVVVIRSGVRHLHSRLLCMRYFIFIDDVETGENGYALATLEAVLAHLSSGSTTLRRASKYNRALWQAIKSGDLSALERILQSDGLQKGLLDLEGALSNESEEEEDEEANEPDGTSKNDETEAGPSNENNNSTATQDFVAVNGSLQHIFPFQRPPTPPPEQVEQSIPAKKRVSMAALPRSLSASSAYSSRTHSRNMSIDSDAALGVPLAGDLSVEKLVQTQDTDGNSLLMMAVEAGQRATLRLLLAMPAHFRAAFVLDDVNNAGTTLLSAAVQSGHREVAEDLAAFLETNASEEELLRYYALQDLQGRCFAHYLFHQPHLIRRFGKKVPWRLKDKNGQTPLFALSRSYDHEEYHAMVGKAISFATEAQGDGEPLHVDDHVDAKGNTLLHIVNDVDILLRLLYHCDADVNATNDKRFTPLMVGSKYGRTEVVRALFGDMRVDLTLRDVRGLSAVELAKDDEVRNRFDDLVLLTAPPGRDGRMTTVVRAFFVEDSTVRLVLKSGAPNPNGTITVTTCRRSAGDFELLARLLAIECPASWLPTHFNLPSPYLIPSKPSRAILRDVQIRLDNFFSALLTHGTFATHELVWEFFLVPDIDNLMLAERSKRKAEARVENVKDEFEPVVDTQEVENFVAFARDQVKGVTSATRRVLRAVNRMRMLTADLADAQNIAANGIASLLFLPPQHTHAYSRYSKTLVPTDASPLVGLYYSLHSIHSTSTALQVATNRPAYLIGSMVQAQRAIERSLGALARRRTSSRWTPRIGFFEDAARAGALEAEEKAHKARAELESLACELRSTQQTIAGELAVWQEVHVTTGRAMLRKLAQDSLVREKDRLESMKRALREARKMTRG